MAKCPKCGKNISSRVMSKGSIDANGGHYLFRCNHCGADLKFHEIWKLILLTLLLIPSVVFLSFKISYLWASSSLLFVIIIFYVVLVYSTQPILLESGDGKNGK